MTVKDKTMLFNVTDARTVRVTGQTHLIEVNKVKNQIVSLIFPSGKTLVQGEKLFVKDKPYKMNVIVDTYINEVLFFDLFVAKKTKSTLLLIPNLTYKSPIPANPYTVFSLPFKNLVKKTISEIDL